MAVIGSNRKSQRCSRLVDITVQAFEQIIYNLSSANSVKSDFTCHPSRIRQFSGSVGEMYVETTPGNEDEKFILTAQLG